MNTLHISLFKSMLKHALEQISKREQEFSDLDAVAGDGDHGTAIVAAMKAIVNASEQGADFKNMLMDMAMGAMQESCGSTSTLIGAFFLGMSDIASGEELSPEQVADMFASGLKNVQQQTQAKVGDKTMMDALMPAVEAMEQAEKTSVTSVLNAGAIAAQEGAEKTKEMQAKFGRARNLGERSLGHADPGAYSWACMLESFAEIAR